jgi:hypothetical protein
MDNLTPENRAELVEHLQRLWQNDPGSYWPALRRSGLTAQDVWPHHAQTFVGVPVPRSESLTSKRKNARKEEA